MADYTGTNGNDVLNYSSSAEAVVVRSGAGADTIIGSASNDFLRGGAGDDVLNGGAGNDYLYGEWGENILTGGEGKDTIVILGYGATDVINDFVAGTDILRLSPSVWSLVTANSATGAGLLGTPGFSQDPGGVNVYTQDALKALISALWNETGSSDLLGVAVSGNDLSLRIGTNTVVFRDHANLALPIIHVEDEATGTLEFTGTAEEGGTLTADVSRITDPDGSFTAAYQWQVKNGSTWVDIAGQTGATLTLPADQSYVGQEVRLTAQTTDRFGGTTDFTSASATVQNVNDRPEIDAPNGGDAFTVSVPENSAAIATVHATDADGDSITYSIAAEGDGGLFEISSTGVLTFRNAPDFENPGDSNGDNSYVVMVQALDGHAGGADTQTITVNVTNVSETASIPQPVTGSGDPNDFDSFSGGTLYTNLSNSQLNGANTVRGTSGSETIDAKSGADLVYGLAGNDTIVSGQGVDMVYGGSGDDRITGNQDVDALYGGSGSDTIEGSQGSDVIIGGHGADNLTGNEDADTFRFLSPSDTGDTITDFRRTQGDKIDIAAVDGTAGSSPFAFGGNSQTFSTGHSVTWYESGGTTIVQVDTDNDLTSAELVIMLSGTVLGLQQTDFIL